MNGSPGSPVTIQVAEPTGKRDEVGAAKVVKMG